MAASVNSYDKIILPSGGIVYTLRNGLTIHLSTEELHNLRSNWLISGVTGERVYPIRGECIRSDKRYACITQAELDELVSTVRVRLRQQTASSNV